MRFRNLVKDRKTGRPAPIFFPYAGPENEKRGREVAANGLSLELPAQRFFHKLLQRDWKLGAIEVLFNEQDKAVLGEAIQGLISEDVVLKPNGQVAAPAAAASTKLVKARRPRRRRLATEPVDAAPPAPAATAADAEAAPAAPAQEPAPAPEPTPAPAAPEPVPAPEPTPAPAAPAPQAVRQPDAPRPVAAPTAVPRPQAAPTRVLPPAVRPPAAQPPPVPRHVVHSPQDVRNQTGIQQMRQMPPQQFAGIPAGVGLADLKRQNDALSGKQPAQPAQ